MKKLTGFPSPWRSALCATIDRNGRRDDGLEPQRLGDHIFVKAATAALKGTAHSRLAILAREPGAAINFRSRAAAPLLFVDSCLRSRPYHRFLLQARRHRLPSLIVNSCSLVDSRSRARRCHRFLIACEPSVTVCCRFLLSCLRVGSPL